MSEEGGGGARLWEYFQKMKAVLSSVADPDPDPVGSGLFGSPGFGSGSGKIPDPDPLSTKRPL